MEWEEVTDCPEMISETRRGSQGHKPNPLGSFGELLSANYADFLATNLLIINEHSACWGPMLGLRREGKEGFTERGKLAEWGPKGWQA